MPDREDPVMSACVELVKDLIKAEEAHDNLKAQTTKAYEEVKKLEAELIKVMDANQLRNFRVEDIGLVYRSNRTYAKITDLDKAMAYFEALGMKEQIFHLTPIRERLNEEVKKALETEASVPGIEYTITPTIGKRKK